MKTKHRIESRAKRATYPMLPKFWQPKVGASNQLTTQIYQWDIITRFTNGSADIETMWSWVEAGLVYSEMARLLKVDGLEVSDEAVQAIKDQLDIFAPVIKRFTNTGRVAFTGPELNIARAAAHVMDQLIAADRHAIAWRAIQWANIELGKLRVLYLLAKEV